LERLEQRIYLYSQENGAVYDPEPLNRLMQNIQALAQNSSNLSTAQQGLAQIPTTTVRMAMATLGILPVIVFIRSFRKIL
jgi:putative aldouronate transport system permease protein